MNIKILDSWIRDFLKTDATPKEIAEKLSLTSVSIERVEKHERDFLYDIEVTTNRPDLASVVGLAREAGAVLPQFDISATFRPPVISSEARDLEISRKTRNDKIGINIANDSSLVNRICAVVLEVTVKPSPGFIKERLETSDIRSLNNLIDITNYVMRTIGHPTHVFDYDRLGGDTLTIHESKKGEEIETLDGKRYILPGGDIVAVNAQGEIVDLLGVMGLSNSVVTGETKRILFFIDNNEPSHIRRTSMSLAIRTEAAQLNEKGLDPELAYEALLYGINLYKKCANGKVVSDIVDIYPNKPKKKTITLSEEKLQTVIGVPIPLKQAAVLLQKLGFGVTVKEKKLVADVPSFRASDMSIPEDLIEEIARVYGYHNIPSLLPPQTSITTTPPEDSEFYWEKRVKEAFKYWGFTEVYTYSMVSEDLYDGPTDEAVTIQNPLTTDFVYMRNSLVLSLLQAVNENKMYDKINLFEIANVYKKKGNDLPDETRMLTGVIKRPNASFFHAKGVVEQLLTDLGIRDISFTNLQKGGIGAEISIGQTHLGVIEVVDEHLVVFELNFELLVRHASLRKKYTPLSKFPGVIEDLSLIADESVRTGNIISFIKKQNTLIREVSLLDKYKDTRTFHIIYQSKERNLTTEEVGEIRKKILKALKEKFDARLKT